MTRSSNTPVRQGYLEFYPDSNLFIYRPNVILTRDKEKIYPKSFKVKLPKRIKYYEFIGASDFAFYYDKSQVVFIKVNLEINKPISDTLYNPSLSELDGFMQQLSTGNKKKYDIKEIVVDTTRVNRIITKGDARILLYNVLKNNKDLFSNYLKTFTFSSQ